MSAEPTPLPLAAAALRLRKKPGRPRTRPRPAPSTAPSRAGVPAAPPLKPQPRATDAPRTRPPAAEMTPRLLGVKEVARYLGVSRWTVRDWLRAGRLRRVILHDCRRRLVDRHDLDVLIERAKEQPS